MTAAAERLESLLAWRAAGVLDPAESRELSTLLARMSSEDESFERAAAAIDLALSGRVPPLPEELREKIRRRALPIVRRL